MPVYVDAPVNSFRGMLMCHMLADTPAELYAMARRLGLKPEWFQASASAPHFDIAKSKRVLAVAAGAVELDRRAFVDVMRRVRASWPRDAAGLWILAPLTHRD